MDDGEKQIDQMVRFILHEGKQRATELDRKAREEFNITKMQIVKEQREKVRKEFQMKLKKTETQRAIARSTAINQCRLKRVAARTAALDEVLNGVKQKLVAKTKDQGQYRPLLTNLIVQGCLKVLESKVQVRCLDKDKAHVKAVLSDAEKGYADQIKKQAGVTRSVSLTIDEKNPLPSSGKGAVLGGVILVCQGGLVTVDNSLDSRLRLTEEQDQPAIRALLFPK